MKNIIFLMLILSSVAVAQTVSRYEAEMLKNPNKGGKDTREVNAVLLFEKDVLKINSRRKKEAFKEIKYSDIKYVEHSYSKSPLFSDSTRAMVLAVLTNGMSLLIRQPEKHWLTIQTGDDFVVLKIENDNYRLLKMEFLVRELDIAEIDENR